MIKNKTTFALGVSILAMIVSISAFLFFYHIIENKNKHTLAVINNLEEKMLQKANGVALAEESTKVEILHQTINGYFVDPAKIDSFVNYLEGIGNSAGAPVQVKNFNVSTSAKNTLEVSISSEGSFSNVMRVLMLIENAPYKIHITKTSFTYTTVTTTDTKDPKKPIQVQTQKWEGDISFNILLSS